MPLHSNFKNRLISGGKRCYIMCTFSWDSLTYSNKIIQLHVIFAVSMPNVWGTIDKLATQDLQP